MSKVYALSVGINDYSPSVGKLRGCLNDVAALKSYLADVFTKDRLCLETLTDSDATRDNIIRLFRSHLGRAGADDVVFLSFQAYGASRTLLAQVMAISFAFQLSVIVIVWLLALSLHAQVPFFYFSAFVPLITLLEALPISIFGLGLRDAGYVFFFGWTGMTELQTRSLALLFFAVAVSYSLIGGLAYLGRTAQGMRKEKSA
ncbi:MAG: lysylphosphatidylglycerol synthase domain-containing protein [Candidatus Electronema sp. VV]